MDGASVSREALVTLAASVNIPAIPGSKNVQGDVISDDTIPDTNDDALDFAINAFLGLT